MSVCACVCVCVRGEVEKRRAHFVSVCMKVGQYSIITHSERESTLYLYSVSV